MRYKPEIQPIQTIDDADKALSELCGLEGKLEEIDTKAEREIAQIRERATAVGKPLRERVKELNLTLKAWAAFHKKDLFKERKSLERPFGTFGYRKSPAKIVTTKETIDLLKKLGHTECVRIKEEVDKEALRDFTDEELAAVGATRKIKEEFFCQTKREQINQDMITKSA